MADEGTCLELDECIRILCEGESIRKKLPTTSDGEQVLTTLKEKVHEQGLTKEQIIQLCDVAASKKFTDSVANSIIKCLVPKDEVPAMVAVKIVSWISTKKLTASLQVSFLKWLILVYDWIDDKSTVHCLYGIIFLLLDHDALSPYLCHLLYFMTKKEDVLLFRVRKLEDLLRKVGVQPHVIGLLSLYKTYSPHSVSVNIPKIRKMFFKPKDTKWLDIAWSVQSLRVENHDKVPTTSKIDIVPLPAAKKRRKDVIIPPFNPVGELTASKRAVTVDQISTFEEFLENIDKLEMPSQMGTALESRYLQHLMVLTQDEAASLRLSLWLQETLNEELLTAPSGETRPRVAKFLSALLDYVMYVEVPIECLAPCLSQYLLTWNGLDYQEQILLLVAHLHFDSFNKLNEQVLEPLRKLFFCSSVYSKCQILSSLSERLVSMAYRTVGIDSSVDNRKSMATMQEFIKFVDKISVVGLQAASDHVLLQHFVLCFFEQVSVLRKDYQVNFVQIPSPSIIYRFFFANNSMIVSRLCQLIVNYKDEFESLKTSLRSTQDGDNPVFPDGSSGIRQLNRYILDVCDSLWRNKAFEDREHSLCYSISRHITDALDIPHINERFSIQHHGALIYLAKLFLMQTQPESQNMNPSLIRGKSRMVYLEFLERHNLHGIISFLLTFLKQKSS